ncbi:MAG: gephyrin-like molybdotransferase Glp [Promethearchaeota archaeon]
MEKLRKVGFARLTSLEDTLKLIYPNVKTNSVEEIEVKYGLNRILATNITSNIDIPPFDRSAMDGYAIRAEDSFNASPSNPKHIELRGKIEIGEFSTLSLNTGEGIRISTGAVIPKGADAVVKIEDTEIENNIIHVYTSVPPGKNVSKKGEDIKKGVQVLTEGIELKAEHIALLSSLGLNKVKVRVKPRVSIFSSGDELFEPGTQLKPGKIYNSNTPMISALVTLYGGDVVKGETVKDEKDMIKNKLIEATENSDIIIFTGGTSVGTKDYLPEIIEESGTVLTHGVAQRPGAPVLIGILNKKLVFCLPGTPVAAYISFLSIAGLVIRKMLGCLILDPRHEIIAQINKDVPVSSLGYIHYLRVIIEKSQEVLIAKPVKLKGSGVISSLTFSDGIVEIPPHREGLKKGDLVKVKLFPK